LGQTQVTCYGKCHTRSIPLIIEISTAGKAQTDWEIGIKVENKGKKKTKRKRNISRRQEDKDNLEYIRI